MKVVDQASGADLDPEHEQGDSRGNRQMNDSSNPEQPPRTMQQWGTGEGKPIGEQHIVTNVTYNQMLRRETCTLS